MSARVARRELIALLGGAAAAPALLLPFPAGAQQPAMPVIGYLNSESSESWREEIPAFHQGLADAGYVEGRNVAIEYRWAESHNDRLPALAAELVRREVSVIAAPGSTAAALAAKAATQTIPIVFLVGADPVELGLVPSLNRPDRNLTGVGALAVGVVAKRLQLLHELVPAADIAFLRNPTNPHYAALETRELQAAASLVGVHLLLLNASSPRELEAAFASLVAQRAGAFLLGTDPFFITERNQLVALAKRYGVPAMYPFREDTVAGGLMSYGASNREGFRMVGNYTGRILNGNKPADLPVQQITKIEMAINLKTAKALGITFPLTFLGRADEAIE
jgi:putative tryptophan/tyrosine transport system substrate-binding protein